MLQAVLLDLDDTLIKTDTQAFFQRYLAMLGMYCTDYAPPEQFIGALMTDFSHLIQEKGSTESLYTRLLRAQAARYGQAVDRLETAFDAFYRDEYPKLRSRIRPQPGSAQLLQLLADRGYTLVLATNPGLPFTAIRQRMTWGQVPPEEHPFALITSLETMSFGKPRPEYYAEIMARLDLDPGSAIMIGDSWDDDIIPASAAGLHTYYVTGEDADVPDERLKIDGAGSWVEFLAWVNKGTLETLEPAGQTRESLRHRLTAFPSAIGTFCENYPARLLECRPADGEWSVRDVICHLRNYAEDEDWNRLHAIVERENPFLSANYDPWSDADRWATMSCEEALDAFHQLRMNLVNWLEGLPAETWHRPARHAIFGPTTFHEMVSFIMEHDRTHWHQLRQALDTALRICHAEQPRS